MQLIAIFQQASRWKQLGVVAILLAVLVLLGSVVYWIAKDDYEPVFTNLSSQEAASVQLELERMKLPYQIAEGGSSILIPKQFVQKAKLKLIGKGVVQKGGVGFEIFNTNEFGVTDFAQRINYQRALQGELSRMIMGMEGIEAAKVLLVLPESGLFRRDSSHPKASVNLSLLPNAQLNQNQIVGIQRLVSSSVPEIDPADVTIVDHRGIAISGQNLHVLENGAVRSSWQIKQIAEEQLKRKVTEILDGIYGANKAVVEVDVVSNSLADEAVTDNSVDISSADLISRISVAVVVATQIDQSKLSILHELIGAAAGINIRRGDVLSIRYSNEITQQVGLDDKNFSGRNNQSSSPPLTMKTSPLTVSLFLAGVLIIIGILGYFYTRFKSIKTVAKLSQVEREAVLLKLNSWLTKDLASEGISRG